MSLLAILQVCCLAAFASLLLIAGWQDLRTMQIANRLCVAIAASFALWAAAGLGLGRMTFTQIGLATICAGAVFLVGIFAFAVGAVGGGDVKLLAAASLFAGPARQLDFLTITALTGGLLGLAVLAGAPIGSIVDSEDRLPRGRLRGGLPYGPAIAAGGLWVAASLVVA